MTKSTADAVTAAVHEAMQTVLPQWYTPGLADEIAADTVARLELLRPQPAGGAR
ncbi:hypothetical protein ABTY96_28560 [Streptomyces sp. NPDC096057]|uniref:hypothetical protein n=1 Tax=Streptomyces sp. NPDC096057 TaxID=3155543 RepID=UPI00331E0737